MQGLNEFWGFSLVSAKQALFSKGDLGGKEWEKGWGVLYSPRHYVHSHPGVNWLKGLGLALAVLIWPPLVMLTWLQWF